MELTWWISWSQHTNLIKDRGFDFVSVCFLICSIIALVNSSIVCKKLENKTLKEFKICIALKVMASFVNWKYLVRIIVHPSTPKSQRLDLIPPSHLPIVLETRRRCTVCCQAGKETRTFVTCSLCDVALCLQKERNCFLQYYPSASSNPYS